MPGVWKIPRFVESGNGTTYRCANHRELGVCGVRLNLSLEFRIWDYPYNTSTGFTRFGQNPA